MTRISRSVRRRVCVPVLFAILIGAEWGWPLSAAQVPEGGAGTTRAEPEQASPIIVQAVTTDPVAPTGPPLPPPPYAFEIKIDAAVEVNAAGTTATDDGVESAFVSMPGSERSGCDKNPARRSLAQGEAKGTPQSTVHGGVTLVLTASAFAFGGARVEDTACLETSTSIPTSAVVKASSTGRVVIQFDDTAPVGPRYYVDQQVSGDTSRVDTLKIFDQFGQEVLPDRPGERPVIVSGPSKVYTAIFKIGISVRSDAPDQLRNEVASITGQVLLESAPAAYIPYIAGGIEAGVDDYLEVTALMINPPEGLKFICTSILITPTTALTAAHCVEPHLQRINEHKTSWLLVGKNTNGTARDWVQIARADFPYSPVNGAEFHYDRRIYKDDIAILYLSRPVVGVTSFARLAKSAEAIIKAFKQQQSVTVVGFGAGYDGSSGAVTAPGVKRYVAREIGRLDPKMLYFSPTPYKVEGVCSGDSGGPAYLSDVGLIGVTSNGPQNYCDGSGFLTRVDVVRNWVEPRIDCIKYKRQKQGNKLTYICE